MDKITGKSKDARVRKDFRRRRNEGQRYSAEDMNRAYDASRRHARRHNESAIENPDLI